MVAALSVDTGRPAEPNIACAGCMHEVVSRPQGRTCVALDCPPDRRRRRGRRRGRGGQMLERHCSVYLTLPGAPARAFGVRRAGASRPATNQPWPPAVRTTTNHRSHLRYFVQVHASYRPPRRQRCILPLHLRAMEAPLAHILLLLDGPRWSALVLAGPVRSTRIRTWARTHGTCSVTPSARPV